MSTIALRFPKLFTLFQPRWRQICARLGVEPLTKEFIRSTQKAVLKEERSCVHRTAFEQRLSYLSVLFPPAETDGQKLFRFLLGLISLGSFVISISYCIEAGPGLSLAWYFVPAISLTFTLYSLLWWYLQKEARPLYFRWVNTPWGSFLRRPGIGTITGPIHNLKGRLSEVAPEAKPVVRYLNADPFLGFKTGPWFWPTVTWIAYWRGRKVVINFR